MSYEPERRGPFALAARDLGGPCLRLIAVRAGAYYAVTIARDGAGRAIITQQRLGFVERPDHIDGRDLYPEGIQLARLVARSIVRRFVSRYRGPHTEQLAPQRARRAVAR